MKKGIIIIVDLSNDYHHLVTFSHEINLIASLMNGPWFIYDHYLTIQKVVVWVRISRLPIDYYDYRVLKHIINKIEITMKVGTPLQNISLVTPYYYGRLNNRSNITFSCANFFLLFY